MTLKSQMDDDMINTFLNSNEHAEAISYTPYGGVAKSINAIVLRRRLDGIGPDRGMTMAKTCEIYIANNATSGVASVDKGRDKVSFAALVGGTARTWTVLEVMDSDDGAWHLLVG